MRKSWYLHKRPKRQEKTKQQKETERRKSLAIGGDLSPSGNDMIVQLDMICQDCYSDILNRSGPSIFKRVDGPTMRRPVMTPIVGSMSCQSYSTTRRIFHFSQAAICSFSGFRYHSPLLVISTPKAIFCTFPSSYHLCIHRQFANDFPQWEEWDMNQRQNTTSKCFPAVCASFADGQRGGE